MSLWGEIPICVKIGGLLVALFALIWKILPDERKEWFWLRTGLKKLDVYLGLPGHFEGSPSAQRQLFLELFIVGNRPKFPLYVEAHEITERWGVHFDRNVVTPFSASKKDKHAATVKLCVVEKVESNRLKIGTVCVNKTLAHTKVFREFMKYNIKCAGFTIKSDELEIE